MASYSAWNTAIADYFLSGVSKGSDIFLSLDEEAIYDIASKFLDGKVNEPLDDFLEAIREHCLICGGAKIDLNPLRNDLLGLPGGIGFLGMLVITAYRMQEEEGIDETNYFLRLREILKLPSEFGRPDGMRAGSEEPLWINWNKFLIVSGFVPTAKRGSGPQTYIKYALSQAILRESDKQFLRQYYRDKKLALQLDRSQLAFWLSRQQFPRKHLNEGVHHENPGRIWEFCQASYRLYEAGDWLEGSSPRQGYIQPISRSIECGLYRDETAEGDNAYRIFPKQLERTLSNQLYVTDNNGKVIETLVQLKPGYYQPLWFQPPFVGQPLQIKVTGNPFIQYLVFPKRDFWVLGSEPDRQSGTFASWKLYQELGDKFLVLCKNGLFTEEMEKMRKAKLIDWDDSIQHESWVEYSGCMVLSYDFAGFVGIPDCRSLVDTLAPRVQCSLSLSGGIRDNHQNAWLEGFPPVIKVYGFQEYFELTIHSSEGTELLHEEVRQQGEVCLSQKLPPDIYEIETKWNGKQVAAKMFRIISWEEIRQSTQIKPFVNSGVISTAGLHLCGPIILESDNQT